MLNEQYASKLNAKTPVYRYPMMPTLVSTVTGTPIGLAKAAMESFLKRLPERGITFASYINQKEAPITHLQVAEAALKIDEAVFHAYRAAHMINTVLLRIFDSVTSWIVPRDCIYDFVGNMLFHSFR
jgi:3-hydroxy-9,10-secoandrosta-1,3,5(10)-triene-9,17-dione monooxygenase